MRYPLRYYLLSLLCISVFFLFLYSRNEKKENQMQAHSLVVQNTPPEKKALQTPVPVKPGTRFDLDKVMPDYFQKPLKIGVIVIVNSLGKIDEKTATFEADLDLRTNWYDPKLAFDPKITGTNRLEYEGKEAVKKFSEIWNPHIRIVNIEGKPINEEMGLFIKEDGNIQHILRVRAKFKTNYYLRSFPFDTEHLNITLISTKYSKAEIDFYQSELDINRSQVDGNVRVIGWTINGLEFEKQTIRGWDGNFYPSLTVNISITRKAIGHLVVLTPLVLIMLMPTFLTLYMEVEMARRLEAWAGAMLALVATSFTLNLRYPTLEPDSIINQLLTLCFGYQFFMIVLTISIFNPILIKQIKGLFLLNEIIRFLRWSIPSGLAVLFVVRVILIALS